MKMFAVRTLLTGISTVFRGLDAGDSLARGWGDSIKWFGLDDGERYASSNGKPVMVIIHKADCLACAALKRRFSVSPGIRQLSQNFVMINLLPNEASRKGILTPDGKYVPRIMFFSPNFVLLSDVKGSSAEYKYFYDDASLIESKMRHVLQKFV